MNLAPAPRGPATAALGAALAAAALGFEARALLLPGLTLLVGALLALVWVEIASRGGRLERGRGPTRLTEGEPYPVRLRLRGTLLRPPGGELQDPLLARPQQVGPAWPRELRRDVVLHAPGLRRLGSTLLVVRDPLGLWRRELSSAPVGDLVVLPRLEPVRILARGGAAIAAGDGAGAAGRRLREGAHTDVDGLRPYRPGSPASRIHWPAVARHGELIERRLSGGGGSRPLVVLDLRGPEARPEAIRAAASLAFDLARRGGCELLLPRTRRPLELDSSLRGWPEAHVRLALAQPGSPAASSASLRGGVVVWVASRGSPRPPAGIGGGYLVSPHPEPERAEFEVAGCYARRLDGSRFSSARAGRAAA